jgi:hypothetical protein
MCHGFQLAARQYWEVPALRDKLCYPTKAPVPSYLFSQITVTVQDTPSLKLRRPKEGMARVFAVKVQSFVEHYGCRGTNAG